MTDKIVIKEQIPSSNIIIKESVTKIYPSLENLNIVPSKQEQVFEHENSYGYDKITVEPIEIKLQNKEIIPSNIDKEVTFDNDYDGLSKVTIKGDSNLIAGNIKQNISIFGITGTYEGNDFNIYMQPNEPVVKNGIWLKSDALFNGVKFFDYATATGEFLEASNFNFLKTEENTVGVEIIDGVMYVIATTPEKSYKVNLTTKVKTNINTPTSAGAYGSCVYENKIYVLNADSSNKFSLYAYDIATDTYSVIYGTLATTEYFSSNIVGNFVYDNKIYFCRYGDTYLSAFIFDIGTQTFSTKGTNILKYNSMSSKTRISVCGPYVYQCVTPNSSSGSTSRAIIRVNLLEGITPETVCTFTASSTSQYVEPYATEDYIYLFNSNYASAGVIQNKYYRYNLLNGTFETITTNNKYFLSRDKTSLGLGIGHLDEQSGILYFRGNGGTPQVSGMQFTSSPETNNLSSGTIAVVQSNYKNSIKIQDSSNIHIGVDNVYLKTTNGLESVETYLGDGTQWNLFKE